MAQLLHSTALSREGLQRWYQSVPGRVLLGEEMRLLDEMLAYLFGYHLVQIGSIAGADLLSRSRILHRAVIAVDGAPRSEGDSSLRGSASELPVASDSVDVVVLPHVLEFEPSPHAALREAGRILMPEGHLLVLGFNPWSWLGLWRVALGRRHGAPWDGQFLGIRRLRDWLALLGFEVLSVQPCFFRPPIGRESLLQRLQLLDRVGKHLWPFLGGSYLIAARKRVIPLTPIRPRWTPRRRIVSVGLAEPSTRGAARG